MRPEDIRHLYDADYAAAYEEKFLTDRLVWPDTAYELEVLESLLQPGASWLDVACGTGFYLRRFQHIHRCGLDLSPAMLAHARQGNPGVDFLEGDFRERRPEWNDRFGLVSCMWYAYTLVDTVRDVVQLVDNLADWTSPTGACFLPLADARMIARSNLPYHVDDGFAGQVTVTGILWSFIEENGAKVHAHCVTPQVEFMVEQFERRFEAVEVVRYPYKADGVHARGAIVAKAKR